MANREAVQKQMDFQQYNSDTAYQRAVKDMQKAGINPALMYASSSASASSPQGASSFYQDPVSSGVNSALNNFKQRQEVMNLVEQNKALSSTTLLNRANARRSYMEAHSAQQRAKLLDAETQNVRAGLSAKQFKSSIYDVGNSLAKPVSTTLQGVADTGVSAIKKGYDNLSRGFNNLKSKYYGK